LEKFPPQVTEQSQDSPTHDYVPRELVTNDETASNINRVKLKSLSSCCNFENYFL